MRIFLYLVSMIGFVIVGYQIIILAASIAAYIAIIVTGVLLMVAAFIIKASFFTALFAAGTVCDLADSANYYEIQKERARLKELERNPVKNNWQRQMQIAYGDFHQLKSLYPFANMQLFQQYSDAIVNKQYDKLEELTLQIEQSHKINMNNYAA